MVNAVAAWSMASAASRICWVASSVPPTTAPSSPVTLDISSPLKLLPWRTAISCLVRVMASWIEVEFDLQLLALLDLSAIGIEKLLGVGQLFG